MANANDPRLRQDNYERKDKENSNAGMIAGIIIVIIGIVGLFLYYTYEVAPTQTTTPMETTAPAPTQTTTAPATTTPAPAAATTPAATTTTQPAPATAPATQQ